MRKSCTRATMSVISLFTWLLGGAFVGYMMWVLSTSPESHSFLTGKLLFTYIVLGFGSSMAIAGLFGWLGSYSNSRSNGLLKMFLFLTILCLAAEIGGISTLGVLRITTENVLGTAWTEVNSDTRSFIQKQLVCCGYNGPEDLVQTKEQVDSTCYTEVQFVREIEFQKELVLNQTGCKEKILMVLEKYKMVWILAIGLVFLKQMGSIILAICLINQKKGSRNKDKEPPDI
ncbi:tetraspanin-18-like [Tachypleus tridentatus]|uniref:tetraspanin-18-like n=1 Tax=Tachypleus tridentatus TaxID=6853 RepID=UPI003FD5AEE2